MIEQMPVAPEAEMEAGVSGESYDVVIVGGAMSGAATAILLRQKNPALRVLIVERAEAFQRRVGESTIEISTFF